MESVLYTTMWEALQEMFYNHVCDGGTREAAPDTMGVLKVVASKTKVQGGLEAEMALACGVKLIKRNQKKMCEAAFEGELEEVQGWLEKGYDLESTDAHNHTPLSEAAAKGHIEVVEYLLDQGRWVDVFVLVVVCRWLFLREGRACVRGTSVCQGNECLSGERVFVRNDCFLSGTTTVCHDPRCQHLPCDTAMCSSS